MAKMKVMKRFKIALLLVMLPILSGCGFQVKYSFSGASIPPEAKTFSVAYFPNKAAMVSPILSSTLTEALVDKFSRQTRLEQVEEGGDFAFEGELNPEIVDQIVTDIFQATAGNW